MSKKKESHGKLGGNLADVHMSKDPADVEIQLMDEARIFGKIIDENARIFERNKDVIRSRKPGDYGNEIIEGNIDEVMDKVIHPLRGRIRAEALDELWAANKVNHNGHWYIRLTDVVNIMGDYDDLYENESRS